MHLKIEKKKGINKTYCKQNLIKLTKINYLI